jgi:hypothetical protein
MPRWTFRFDDFFNAGEGLQKDPKRDAIDFFGLDAAALHVRFESQWLSGAISPCASLRSS